MNQILDKKQIIQKIRRMVFEILENNFQENSIIFAGIEGSGYILAQMIQKEYASVSAQETVLLKVSLNKFQPTQSEVILDKDVKIVEDQTIILIDDVLNTGRTFAYSLKPFLKVGIKKMQTVVLVDRNHKNFPISADYVGYSLSTTLQEHITVVLDDETKFGVYLS